jgi:ATP-dependent DNA helicase DinG
MDFDKNINIRDEVVKFFEEDGLLRNNFPNFEYRESQMKMALSVLDSLENQKHLFVEAPTGIGKSLAYLVPAIYYAKKYGKKAVVSTHTINLQEQISGNDIPLLKKILPFEFEASLLKGKTNYICPHRLRKAYENSNALFEDNELITLEKIYRWSKNTKDGTISDTNFNIEPGVWQNVCAEVNVCTNKTCGDINDTECFFQKAKHKVYKSDIVILNHYLFFTLFNAASKDQKSGFLYLNDFVLFDEGHTLEDAASEMLVPKVSREMLKYHLLRLYNDKKKKGFLVSFPALQILPVVQNLLDINQNFFYELKRKVFSRQFDKYDKLSKRIRDKGIIHNHLNDEIQKLITHLKDLKKFAKNDIVENEISDYIIRFAEMNRIINDFIELKEKEYVYWVEQSSNSPDANTTLCASPLDISDYLREHLFKDNNSAIITSATLSIDGNFSYYKNRLGGEIADEIKLPTQFDYYRQVKIIIPNDNSLTPAKDSNPAYVKSLTNWIEKTISKTNGKALVLFTNSLLMKSIGNELRDKLNEQGLQLLIQGEGLSRKNLLDKFKLDINSVLFGLDSFWLGVDVPGESLSNLILTKLPFTVPDHPLIQARLEYIDSEGGNSFMDYSLPEAVLKFRQGAGRLIRSKSDEGIITILDFRILSKQYGKYFLNALEECPIDII